MLKDYCVPASMVSRLSLLAGFVLLLGLLFPLFKIEYALSLFIAVIFLSWAAFNLLVAVFSPFMFFVRPPEYAANIRLILKSWWLFTALVLWGLGLLFFLLEFVSATAWLLALLIVVFAFGTVAVRRKPQWYLERAIYFGMIGSMLAVAIWAIGTPLIMITQAKYLAQGETTCIVNNSGTDPGYTGLVPPWSQVPFRDATLRYHALLFVRDGESYQIYNWAFRKVSWDSVNDRMESIPSDRWARGHESYQSFHALLGKAEACFDGRL